MKYYIMVFKNTHDAMNAEKVLKEKGYKFRIMPTPTTITQSCGICVRVDSEEILKEIMNEGLDQKNIYLRDSEGYKEY